ncbi:DUF378 domain-containing protein [Candidatus Chlamydia sanziniae]|uniref:Uncharacterized protein n=1 Tax=Candidatus Chlamydia sanziniae TaxID=1806891 RepID=A0A1A9HVW2_9CHLA|nr:DUF378 domain-containing protein [Candidatus Chlamydia sanziniae]ANH78243.1 hypothetical protein Cs308_0067 [Candidatus Chlamydia sanziniae]
MLGKFVRGLSSLILVLSALNVGILGITHQKVNLIAKLCGGTATPATQLAYIVIGIAGIIYLFSFFRNCCAKKSSCSKGSSCSTGSCSTHHPTGNE